MIAIDDLGQWFDIGHDGLVHCRVCDASGPWTPGKQRSHATTHAVVRGITVPAPRKVLHRTTRLRPRPSARQLAGFAGRLDGQPYRYDCSGLVDRLHDTLAGQDPYTRTLPDAATWPVPAPPRTSLLRSLLAIPRRFLR